MRIIVGLALVFAATLAEDLPKIDLSELSPAVAIVNTTESFKSGRVALNTPKSAANQGVAAIHGLFPYHVAVLTSKGAFCSGALVSVRNVITAAHCVVGAKNVTVFAGVNNLLGNEHVQYRTSKDITVHPRYNATSMENDVAVISINKSTPFSPNTWVQTLNMSNKTSEGTWARTSGWGSRRANLPVGEFLRYEDFTIISNKECQNTFGTYVTNSTICAVPQTNRTNCVLDSGSPLVDLESGQLIGVATFTAASTICSTGSPVAYMRATSIGDFAPFN